MRVAEREEALLELPARRRRTGRVGGEDAQKPGRSAMARARSGQGFERRDVDQLALLGLVGTRSSRRG
jgi:hypothetical protein